MKTNFTTYLSIIVIALFASTVFLGKKLVDERTNSARLSNNLEIALDSTHFYKTKSGQNAATTRPMNLTKKEFKKLQPQAIATAKGAGVKPRSITSYSETGTHTGISFTGKITKDSARLFAYNDPWTTVSGSLHGDSIRCNINNRDTLITIANRIQRRILFFKFNTKKIKIDIISKNPHTKITYAKHITIQ